MQLQIEVELRKPEIVREGICEQGEGFQSYVQIISIMLISVIMLDDTSNGVGTEEA